MSLFDEKVRAVKRARELMRSLLDPKKTPKVPKSIREEAYWTLKHFPADFDVTIRPDFGCAPISIVECKVSKKKVSK